jgi:cyclase
LIYAKLDTFNVKNRRIMLPTRIIVFLFLLFPHGLAARTTPSENAFVLKPLGQNVWIAVDSGTAKANAGFVIGDDSVAVVDTFANEEAARQLLIAIRRLTNLPVKFVVNTSYRWEHVAGNEVFKEAGAVILAHRNVREWIHTENARYTGKDAGSSMTTILQLVPPQLIYDHSVDVFLGARLVRVVWRLGVTGGDSVVFVPDANVVFCGDLFSRNTVPNLIDASTGPWMTTLEVLARSHRGDRFVPGHGDIGTDEDVLQFRQFLFALRNLTGAALRSGKSGDDLAGSVIDGLRGTYGRWAGFGIFAKPGALFTASEMRGEKRIPRPVNVE